ncbi:MAG: DMT family transporter [Verrucomicrobia bacterium]|nr:DMT family transporter [Verrucomicrobiota bacterium]
MDFSHSKTRRLEWGIFFILLAWLTFTLMATFSKFATRTVSLPIVLFFQNFVAFLLMVPWVFKHKISSLKTKHFTLILVRSIAGLGAFLFLFLAVQKTTLVDAVLLNNAGPLLVPFGALLWKKVPIEHKLWPGIVAGFLGITLILKPGSEIFNGGGLYGLGAAVGMCAAMLTVHELAKTERHYTILFYYFLIASLCCVPWSLAGWRVFTPDEWFYLLSIGLLSFLGQWAFLRAFHNAQPIVLGPFCYMAVVYSGFIQWILWGHVPDWIAILGILLVCAGGIWTIVFTRYQPKNRV